MKKIDKYIKYEEIDYIKRMNVSEGIALNSSLCENIFALVVSICTKIPIFICGKPGCSKSLSVNIIKSNMKGSNSYDPFLATLPEIFMIYF